MEEKLDDLLMNIDEVSSDDNASTQAMKPVWEITFDTEDNAETHNPHNVPQTDDIGDDAPDLIIVTMWLKNRRDA